MVEAEQILEADVGAVVGSAMDAISQAGMWIVWTLIIGAIVGAVVYIFSFKHSVSIRVLTRGGNETPIKDRAREVKVDGVTYWKLLKRRDVIPIPPSEALKLLNNKAKPKYYAEFSWSDETGYVPLRYDVTTDNFNGKLEMLRNGQVINEPFQPFTSNQRSLYVMQIRKAEQRRKKDILERITALATPIVLAMLVISILVFWEDVAKPGKEIAELNVQMQKQNIQLLEQVNEISAQNARIVQAYTGADIALQQQVTQ